MDDEQQQRFAEAVERKARESERRSRATQHGPPAGGIERSGGEASGRDRSDQEELRSPAQPQDTFSPREKSTAHKKVTADKWNQ